MIRIPCPFCGLRDEGEFTYGGAADARRPEQNNDDMRAWLDYVFYRDNPRGMHAEYWHHAQGCRQWLVVRRDTLTHSIESCRTARERKE